MAKRFWLSGTIFMGMLLPLIANADLPREVSARDFQNIKTSSPFTRSLNLPNNMILTGVADLEGKEVAILMNGETGESIMVSSAKNSLGWTLVKVSGPDNIKEAIATVSSGDGQSFRVGYDKKLHAELMKKKSVRVAAARPKPTDNRNDAEKKKSHDAIKQKWNSLSKEQQAEARKILAEKFKAKPDINPKDRGTMYIKVMDYVRSKK